MVREASAAPAHSPDLRERVPSACSRGDLPQVEIARRLQVYPDTASNWSRQEREMGRRKPEPYSGGVLSRLDAMSLAALHQLMIEDNDSLLREYRERLAERTGVTVCLAVICVAVRRFTLRRSEPRRVSRRLIGLDSTRPSV
jgi:transposase